MGYVHVCRSSSNQATVAVAPTTIVLEDDEEEEEEEMVDVGNVEALEMVARVLESVCSTMPLEGDEYQRQGYRRSKPIVHRLVQLH